MCCGMIISFIWSIGIRVPQARERAPELRGPKGAKSTGGNYSTVKSAQRLSATLSIRPSGRVKIIDMRLGSILVSGVIRASPASLQIFRKYRDRVLRFVGTLMRWRRLREIAFRQLSEGDYQSAMHVVPAHLQSKPHQVRPMRAARQIFGNLVSRRFTASASADK
jgi:hypothetical protein